MLTFMRFVLVMALLVPAACGSRTQDGPAGDCAAAGARMLELSQARLDELDDRASKLARTQLQLVRDRFVKTCREQAWPDEARACLITAADSAAFDACAARLAPASDTTPPGSSARTE